MTLSTPATCSCGSGLRAEPIGDEPEDVCCLLEPLLCACLVLGHPFQDCRLHRRQVGARLERCDLDVRAPEVVFERVAALSQSPVCVPLVSERRPAGATGDEPACGEQGNDG